MRTRPPAVKVPHTDTHTLRNTSSMLASRQGARAFYTTCVTCIQQSLLSESQPWIITRPIFNRPKCFPSSTDEINSQHWERWACHSDKHFVRRWKGKGLSFRCTQKNCLSSFALNTTGKTPLRCISMCSLFMFTPHAEKGTTGRTNRRDMSLYPTRWKVWFLGLQLTVMELFTLGAVIDLLWFSAKLTWRDEVWATVEI